MLDGDGGSFAAADAERGDARVSGSALPAHATASRSIACGWRRSQELVDSQSRRASVDLLVLDSIAAMLDDLGHAVIEARSGEEAVGLLPRMPKIDIVVTDYAMPGMNGLQLAEAVAAERPGTPVVLCTGYAELPGSTQPHLPRISKPLDQTALVAAIEEAMRVQADMRSVLTLHPKRA
jgi:CheY-like chemotaxis protein